jgi:hypothetical protein
MPIAVFPNCHPQKPLLAAKNSLCAAGSRVVYDAAGGWAAAAALTKELKHKGVRLSKEERERKREREREREKARK